jgi:hypothetical protein
MEIRHTLLLFPNPYCLAPSAGVNKLIVLLTSISIRAVPGAVNTND